MKFFRYSFVLFFVVFSYSVFGQFLQNKGQLIDFNGDLHPEVEFYKKGAGFDIYFRKGGLTYIYKKSSFIADEQKKEQENYNSFISDSSFYFRVDMNFDNANSDVQLLGKENLKEVNNYYLPHCSDGILNVPISSKLVYKNVYDKIDIHFYLKDGKLKYDAVVHPGANLADLRLKFPDIEHLVIKENKLVIKTPIGEVHETLPRSYVVLENGKEEDVEVAYKLVDNIVEFDVRYDKSKLLVIDPEVYWQTLYQESFGIGNSNSLDSKGNQLVNVGYTFSASYPLLNPGGGAYYQNAIAGSGDIRIVKFDTLGVRVWSTYYGGSDYEHSPDVVIDYNDQIIVSMQTESADIPLQNAGGYYDASYTAGTYNWASTYIARFNSAGVRNWGTHYDHFQYPLVDVDLNNNIILVGQSQYDNPPVQSLSGAYNQSTVALNASGSSSSGDFFIVKFNSSTSRLWATNLGGTCREMMGKIAVDNNNNFYIWGGGDNYYGTSFIKQDAGGYYDSNLGVGTGGTSADRADCLLYKFSSAGAMLWGTAFGGSGSEWAWGSQADITTDDNNNVYIACNSSSTDLPVMAMGSSYYDGTFSNPTGTGNPYNHFIARFNPSTEMEWCTYWGNYSFSHATSHGVELEFNKDNNLTVALGVGNGDHYPLVNRSTSYNQAYQSGDVHIGEFDSNFELVWGTYYGGASGERLGDMVFTENSNSFFMCNSWYSSSGALWVPAPTGAYYDGTYVSSAQLISKFSPVLCDVAVNATTTAAICESATKPLVGTPSGGTWAVVSGGGSISGTTYTPANITSATSVTVSYTIAAVGGCPLTSENITFTVNPDASQPGTITGTTPVCSGVSQSYSISSVSGATSYTWSYSGGGTPSGTSISTTFSPTSSGTLSVTATNGCGTSSAATLAIVVNDAPSQPGIITGTTPVCNGASESYSISSVSGATSYTWSYTGSGTPSGTSTSTTFSPTSNGTLSVTATNSCGTSSAATLAIIVNDVPSQPTTITGTTPVCNGTSENYSISSVSGATSYTWSYSGSGSPSGTSNSTTFTPTSSGTLSVTATNSCGTSASETLAIVVNDLDDASFAYTGATYCLSGTDPAASISGLSGGSFTGTTTLVIDGATGEIDLDVSGIGSYTVTYTTTGSCPNTSDVNVTITGSPSDPSVSSTSGSTICAGDTTIIDATGSGTNITYNIYDALTGGNLLGTAPLEVTPNSSTDYYVVAVNLDGCVNLGGGQIISITANPLPSVDAGSDEALCPGDNVILTAVGTGTYLWSTSETTASVTVQPSSTTIYIVELTDGNGCVNSDSITVTIQSVGGSLIAEDDSFTIDANVETTLDVLLNDTYNGIDVTIVLDPQNGVAIEETDGTISYTANEGSDGMDNFTYTICDAVCTSICDTAEVILTIIDDIGVSVSGGFSPNGDNINDLFTILGLDQYPENKLSIFNRWGNLIYTSTPYNNDWNGTATEGMVIMGDKVPTGTYFYILELEEGTEPLKGSLEIKQ